MEEITKEIFKQDIRFIKDICKSNRNCEECKFKDKQEGCIFEASPDYWNENIIAERAFRK